MPRVLIADDDTDLRTTLRELLTDEGFDVNEADTGEAVLASLGNGASDRPSLVIMDVRMPGKNGMDVLRELRDVASGSQLPVLVMTAYGSSNIAIEAMQLGAYDYITKPFDLDDILATIKRYFDWQELNDQVIELSTRLSGAEPEAFIGNSPAMQEVYKTIGRVARSDATVLISGETGTGKELVATILHRNSGYARGPLIKVNCAALPETLLESELFGHEKGAFTGAIAQRKGRFEMANKGTIFLDEIGEMTLRSPTPTSSTCRCWRSSGSCCRCSPSGSRGSSARPGGGCCEPSARTRTRPRARQERLLLQAPVAGDRRRPRGDRRLVPRPQPRDR